MSPYYENRQAYPDSELPTEEKYENLSRFKGSQIHLPSESRQSDRESERCSSQIQSAGMIDASHPHGPHHKRQRSSSNVLSDSPLPQILGFLSGASQEEKEKIMMAIIGSQSHSSRSLDFNTSPSTEVVPGHHGQPILNSDAGRLANSGKPGMTSSSPVFQQGDIAPLEWTGTSEHWAVPNPHSHPVIDPGLMASKASSSKLRNYGDTSRASMPLPTSLQQIELPTRSHFSTPLPYCSHKTSAYNPGGGLLRQAVHSGIVDADRDSVYSSSSCASLESGLSVNSEYTAASSLSQGSLASQTSRKSSLGTPSSTGQTGPPRARRSASSARKASNSSLRSIPCRFAPCPVTFSREDTRNRHERQKHDPEVATYTCLLDTCNLSCSYDCQITYHNNPFQDTRIDKMKAHLDKSHNWGLTQADIPEYWCRSFEHHKWGWICCDCGTDLGNWEANPRFFVQHFKMCVNTRGLQDDILEPDESGTHAINESPAVSRLGKMLHRLSTEGTDIEKEMLEARLTAEKPLPAPPKPLQLSLEDMEYWKDVVDEWSHPN